MPSQRPRSTRPVSWAATTTWGALAVGKLTEQVSVLGTWVNSRKTDTEAFVAQVAAMDPAEHKGLPATAITHRC